MTKTEEVIKTVIEDRFATSIIEFLKENKESMLDEIKTSVWPYDDAVERSLDLLDRYAIVDHVFVDRLTKDFYRLSKRGKRIYSIIKESIDGSQSITS